MKQDFIRLTVFNGEVAIRIDAIQAVKDCPIGCELWLSNAQSAIYVDESYEKIIKFLSDYIQLQRMGGVK